MARKILTLDSDQLKAVEVGLRLFRREIVKGEDTEVDSILQAIKDQKSQGSAIAIIQSVTDLIIDTHEED